MLHIDKDQAFAMAQTLKAGSFQFGDAQSDVTHRFANLVIEHYEHLRSAAPDLLRVVMDMVEAVETGAVRIDGPNIGGGDPEIGYEPHYWGDEWLHHAKAALAKARGEGK